MRNRIFAYVLFVLTASIFSIEKNELYSQEKIIFFHIPKTGGVTVSSLLMNQYDTSQIIGNNISLHSYGFHFSYYETKNNLDISDFKLITFLRNPVDRVLSEQRYCIEKHHADPQILKAHRLSIKGEPIETVSNVACKMLSGLDDKDTNISIEEHLACAKKALANQFFFIGITEKMNESIELLFSLLNWPTPEEIPQFNATDTSNHYYSNELLEAIAKRNWADIELYEHALTLYEKQKNQILSFEKEYLNETPAFVSNCYYTFNQKLNGYGWCPREYLKDGSSYRWISDSNLAAIDFFLTSDRAYSLNCMIFIQPILLKQFNLLVNDTHIDVEFNIREKMKQNTQFAWIECSAEIPQYLLRNGEKIRLIFEIKKPTEDALLQYFEMNDHNQSILTNFTKGKCACKWIYLKSL